MHSYEKKKKIGIITNHRALNYGSALQGFALFWFLSKYHEVKVIDYYRTSGKRSSSRNTVTRKIIFIFKQLARTIIFRVAYRKRSKRFQTFFKKVSFTEKRFYSFGELISKMEKFDTLISGSDQIWNPGLWGNLIPAYFLAFCKDGAKKISYASSMGSGEFNDNEKYFVKEWLGDFSAMGVREDYTKQYLEKTFSVESKLVIDPTFLLTSSDWDAAIEDSRTKAEYILLYSPNQNPAECFKAASVIKNRLGDLGIIYICDDSRIYFKYWNKCKIITKAGPVEFINLLRNASFVVTNSFHGTALSVIFKKNFINIFNKTEPERAKTLLNKIGLQERIVTDLNRVATLNIEIDYTNAEKELEAWRRESIDFLINAV